MKQKYASCGGNTKVKYLSKSVDTLLKYYSSKRISKMNHIFILVSASQTSQWSAIELSDILVDMINFGDFGLSSIAVLLM